MSTSSVPTHAINTQEQESSVALPDAQVAVRGEKSPSNTQEDITLLAQEGRPEIIDRIQKRADQLQKDLDAVSGLLMRLSTGDPKIDDEIRREGEHVALSICEARATLDGALGGEGSVAVPEVPSIPNAEKLASLAVRLDHVQKEQEAFSQALENFLEERQKRSTDAFDAGSLDGLYATLLAAGSHAHARSTELILKEIEQEKGSPDPVGCEEAIKIITHTAHAAEVKFQEYKTQYDARRAE